MISYRDRYSQENTIFDLLARLEDNQRCWELLELFRWPLGFICPKCTCNKHYWLEEKRLYQCANDACRYQCSLTAGTTFHATKLPIKKWFMAIFYMMNHQSGISGTALSKLIFVSEKTARRMLTKLREVMEDSNQRRFIEALFFKIKFLIERKNEVPTVKSAVLVQIEPAGVGKVIFKDPTNIENLPKMEESEAEDPATATLVGSALTHLRRFLLGTFHQYNLPNFSLYLAEFTYRFNEPDPAKLIVRLLSDCLRVPFDEGLAVLDEW